MGQLTLTIERPRVFNGLDVLVAIDEGLFAEEGLDLRMVTPVAGDMRPATDGTLLKPVTNQGRLQARGEAAMFQG
jgi:hypothetical protein